MNKFESKFFDKYIPEGHTIKTIIHEHWIKIVNSLVLSFGMAVFVPTMVYYYSGRIQELVPFYAFEIYLIVIFFKILYDIFDWYNDVWIVTDKGVVDLDWALFKTNMKTVNYENIEGVEVEQNSIWDKILRKGNLVIHKIGDDVFMLEDARIPYKALNEIEKTREEIKELGEDEEDKFDMVMDTLSGVVKEYLGKNGFPRRGESADDFREELLEKSKSKSGTIDLR
ncbi:MAG: hypothetical protein PHH06_04095 [Candidatus Gracilibacteria bacterium]|nr:hypothetical protein [Candidatus Gracilibacteria bacterium]